MQHLTLRARQSSLLDYSFPALTRNAPGWPRRWMSCGVNKGRGRASGERRCGDGFGCRLLRLLFILQIQRFHLRSRPRCSSQKLPTGLDPGIEVETPALQESAHLLPAAMLHQLAQHAFWGNAEQRVMEGWGCRARAVSRGAGVSASLLTSLPGMSPPSPEKNRSHERWSSNPIALTLPRGRTDPQTAQ